MQLTSRYYRFMQPIALPVEAQLKLNQTEVEIPLNHILIQGAKPYDSRVARDNSKMQGGYRLEIEILTQPSRGVAALADNRTGLVYRPNVPGQPGVDSFSYRLVSPNGQFSEPECVYIIA